MKKKFMTYRSVSVLTACIALCFAAIAQAAVDTPTIIGPGDGETISIAFPSFYWDGADVPYRPLKNFDTRYEIKIASDANGRNIIDADTVAIPRYVPDRPLIGTFYWRVRALRGGEKSAWSDVRSFTVKEPSKEFPVPNGASSAEIISIISNAAASKAPSRVVFAKNGLYRIQSTVDALVVSDARDMIIDGNGANIVILTNSTGFLRMYRSVNVMLKDFFIDYDPLPYSVARVKSANGDTVSFSLELGHQPFDSPMMQISWTWGVLFDNAVRGRLKNNVQIVIGSDKKSLAVNGNEFSMNMAGGFGKYFLPGERYIQFARDKARSLVLVTDSSNIVFYQITNYATPAGHYMALESSDMKYIHVGSPIKEGRFFGGNADGIHVRANSIGPWVEGCEFNGVGDDGIALYNKAMFILEKVSATAIRVKKDEFFTLRPGEQFCLFNPRDGKVIREGLTATESEYKAAGAGFAEHYLVSFSPPAEDILLTSKTGLENDQAFTRSRVNGLFMIRSNYIHNIRRYGSVIRAVNGVVENNRYEGCSTAGIIFRNEASHWRNGLFSDSVLVSGNSIIDSAFDGAGEASGSIIVKFERLEYEDARTMAQKNIFIESNTILNWHKYAMRINGAEHIVIRGNTIASTMSPNTGSAAAIVAVNASDITVTGNSIRDDRLLAGGIVLEKVSGAVTNGNTVTAKIDVPAANETVIGIDDGECTFTGDWKSSGLRGYKGKKTLYTTENGASARWVIPANVKGKTKVYYFKVWHTAENDPAVKIEITHTGGTKAVTVDTTKGQSEWVELGSYSFSGKTSEGVRVVKADGGNTRVSAVKFVTE